MLNCVCQLTLFCFDCLLLKNLFGIIEDQDSVCLELIVFCHMQYAYIHSRFQ